MFLIDIRPINEENLKQCFRKLCESKGIFWIYRVPYNSQHQAAVKVSNRTVQNFFTSEKDHIKEK